MNVTFVQGLKWVTYGLLLVEILAWTTNLNAIRGNLVLQFSSSSPYLVLRQHHDHRSPVTTTAIFSSHGFISLSRSFYVHDALPWHSPPNQIYPSLDSLHDEIQEGNTRNASWLIPYFHPVWRIQTFDRSEMVYWRFYMLTMRSTSSACFGVCFGRWCSKSTFGNWISTCHFGERWVH